MCHLPHVLTGALLSFPSWKGPGCECEGCGAGGGVHHRWNLKMSVRAVVQLETVQLERVQNRLHLQPVGNWSQPLGRKPLVRARCPHYGLLDGPTENGNIQSYLRHNFEEIALKVVGTNRIEIARISI